MGKDSANKTPIDEVLGALEDNRKRSMNESDKTDLGGKVPTNEINNWYYSIQQLMKENPPTRSVKTVIIKTDIQNEVKEIEYVYGTKQKHSVSFQILLDN